MWDGCEETFDVVIEPSVFVQFFFVFVQENMQSFEVFVQRDAMEGFPGILSWTCHIIVCLGLSTVWIVVFCKMQ